MLDRELLLRAEVAASQHFQTVTELDVANEFDVVWPGEVLKAKFVIDARAAELTSVIWSSYFWEAESWSALLRCRNLRTLSLHSAQIRQLPEELGKRLA